MPNSEELMLQDLQARYSNRDLNPAFKRLYEPDDPATPMFTIFHTRLNSNFEFMNQKAQANRHFNAHESRDLLELLDELREAKTILELAGAGFELDESYEEALRRCEGFLVASGGSTIPEDFEPISIVKWKSVFRSYEKQYRRTPLPENYDLKAVGSGSYANVFRYKDPEYDRTVALKRVKKGTSEQDLLRFKREFETLKSLSSPYVIEVYRFNEDRSEYTMEYCESTLRDFIDRENQRLGFGTRKRIALQFLYGLNYLHGKGHLHRDVSYQNALIKRFHGNVVLVKLSDFGLEKRVDSDLTRTESELRGTILDPTLRTFKDYSVVNEVYSIGFVLSFIFSGRTNIDACEGPTLAVIRKCTDSDVSARFADVLAIIGDVEQLSPGSS